MSEEEQIAIETLKELVSDDFDTLGDDISPKMAQNILNVIDKQQKEIERLDKKIEREEQYEDYYENLCKRQQEAIRKQQKEIEENQVLIDDIKDHRIVYIDTPEFEEKYISKDKIRKYLNSLKYWEDNNTCFLESKGEIFLNKELIVNIFEDLLKEK